MHGTGGRKRRNELGRRRRRRRRPFFHFRPPPPRAGAVRPLFSEPFAGLQQLQTEQQQQQQHRQQSTAHLQENRHVVLSRGIEELFQD